MQAFVARSNSTMQVPPTRTMSPVANCHHELHPLGDVTLQLRRCPLLFRSNERCNSDSSPCTILASTAHLSAASPVFRAMFTPNTWSESSNRVVPLPDDDHNVLLILLYIIHLQFLKVRTSTMDRSMLYQLAVLCDKYDCLELVAPWLQRWKGNHRFDGRYLAGDLFICWTFGLGEEFETAMGKLIRETRWEVDAGEGVLIRGGVAVPFDDEVMPGDALESVRSVRHGGLKCLEALLHSTMNKYKSTERRVCKGLSKYDLCDAAVFGCFMRSMQDYILYDSSGEKDIPHSIEEIAAAISAFRVVLPERGHYESKGHEECDISKSLRAACVELLAQLGTGVTDAHRKQLQQQAAKCGSNVWVARYEEAVTGRAEGVARSAHRSDR